MPTHHGSITCPIIKRTRAAELDNAEHERCTARGAGGGGGGSVPDAFCRALGALKALGALGGAAARHRRMPSEERTASARGRPAARRPLRPSSRAAGYTSPSRTAGTAPSRIGRKVTITQRQPRPESTPPPSGVPRGRAEAVRSFRKVPFETVKDEWQAICSLT